MACAYHGGWNLAIAGTEQSSGDAKVWTCVYGDGGALADGAWSPLREINTAKSTSGVSFHHPFLANADVMRLTFVERYTGTSNYQRSAHTHGLGSSSHLDNLWREPVPLNIASTYGVAIASSASHLWLCTPGGVWRGDRRGSTVDLSEDVVGLNVREVPVGGAAVIRLRNDHGRYGSVGEGSLGPLRLGSTVSVSPGYETEAGREVSNGPSFSIEGFEHISYGGGAELAIHARSAWQALESWRARRQYTWTAGAEALPAIVRSMLARAGLQASVSGAGAEAAALSPSFTIHPGETAASAVRRLLVKAPVVLQFSGHTAHLRELSERDSADYVYGTDHPILRGTYRSGAREYNRVQVFGKAHLGEAFDWEEVGEVFERLLQVHDLNMDTTQKALDRARSVMRRQALDALGGETVTPVNCGLELYDIVEVNDAVARTDGGKAARDGAGAQGTRGCASRSTSTCSRWEECDLLWRYEKGSVRSFDSDDLHGDRADGGQPGHVAGGRAGVPRHTCCADNGRPYVCRHPLRSGQPERRRGRRGVGLATCRTRSYGSRALFLN